MNAKDRKVLADRIDYSPNRGLQLKTQLFVVFVLVTLLPAFLIAGALLMFQLGGGDSGLLGRVSGVGLSAAVVVTSIVVALVAALAVTRDISRRLDRIVRAATEISDGHLERRLPVDRSDEIGHLAEVVNRLVERLSVQVADLRLDAATQAKDAAYRSEQLEAVISSIHRAVAWHDADRLLQVAVDQTAEELGFDHVAVYLLDDTQSKLVLRACHDTEGDSFFQRTLNLTGDADSSAAVAINTGERSIDQHTRSRQTQPDVQRDEPQVGATPPSLSHRFAGPSVRPETLSELSLPLRVDGHVAGVLNVQSTIQVFTEATVPNGEPVSSVVRVSPLDVVFLEIIAAQIGEALGNSQLLYGAEAHMTEAPSLAEAAGKEDRAALLSEHRDRTLVYDGVGVRTVAAGEHVIDTPDLTLHLSSGKGLLGTVKVAARSGEAFEPGDVAVAEAIVREAMRALERAWLYQGTQDTRAEIGTLYRCCHDIVGATSSADVLAAVVKHMGALGEAAAGPLDSGLLLLREVTGSGWRLRIDSTTGRAEDLVDLVDEVWEPERLPLLKHAREGDADPDGVIAIADIGQDGHLDAASRHTLSEQLSLQAALVLPLRVRHDAQNRREADAAAPADEAIDATGEDLVGWFLIGSSSQPHLFTDLELRIYRSIAELAATVIRSLQLTNLARERVRQAQVVGQISTRMRETLDMDLILQSALREIGDNLDIPSIEVQMGQLVSDGQTPNDIEPGGVSADDAVTDGPAELEPE